MNGSSSPFITRLLQLISMSHQKLKKMCYCRLKFGLGEVISFKKLKARLVIVTYNYIWSTQPFLDPHLCRKVLCKKWWGSSLKKKSYYVANGLNGAFRVRSLFLNLSLNLFIRFAWNCTWWKLLTSE